MKKIVAMVILIALATSLAGCTYEDSRAIEQEQKNTKQLTKDLVTAQPTPTDIQYSLQRYNLIRRAYWMNGMEEKARTLPCEVNKPLGYIYLFLEGIGCVAEYAIDGQITPLTTYLTPDTTSPNHAGATWLADVDGTYGENQDGIFFFTVDGEYKEWNGTYHYSSVYLEIEDVVLKVSAK